MKKKLKDPRIVLGIGLGMFCIALINSIQNDARSFGDLDLWGKIFVMGIPLALGYWIVLLIISLIKKR